MQKIFFSETFFRHVLYNTTDIMLPAAYNTFSSPKN